MHVILLDEHPAARLAGEELVRCLTTMTGARLRSLAANEVSGQRAIYLGIGETVSGVVSLPEVDCPKWDDAWSIRSVGDGLVIAGVNPRSTLMAAYHYLRMLGAEWLWPGKDGEHLPRVKEIPLRGIDVRQSAADRHRGVCIEGAPAVEHVLDMVEWLPRVGLNSYFLQFQVSSHFWRCWYEHRLNPRWQTRRELTERECEELEAKVVAAVKERDLLLHRVGHGWTAGALGLPTNDWIHYDGELHEDSRRLTAEVAGHRGLWQGTPINTELCYSDPDARRRVADAVLRYAGDHPEVDVLHLWLSDAVNNHCECSGCRGVSPSDWYVALLNEISPRLKNLAPNMKLAFLAYLDTLWPPQHYELDLSNDNLVYVFAPISRCYGHHLADPACGTNRHLQRPPLNEVVVPQDNRDNWALLDLWRSVRPADSFAYDYHFMVMWIQDHMSVNLADLIPQDVADYRDSGINGLVSCCTQRAFYPNGWPYWVMARSLLGETPGADEKARYFARAYGDSAQIALGFLDRLASLSGGPIHSVSWWDTADLTTSRAVLEFLDAQEPHLAAGRRRARGPAQERAWRLLLHHRQLLSFLWGALQEKVSGRTDKARTELRRAEAFLQESEQQTAPALDTYLMLQYVSGLME